MPSFRICHDWYTRSLFAECPNARFVFGDNTKRYGRGGQAAVCRDHPQAIGVATLWEPSVFFTDCPEVVRIVADDLRRVQEALTSGFDVYWPAAGIGTGLAHLKENAPGVFAFIEAYRDELLKSYP